MMCIVVYDKYTIYFADGLSSAFGAAKRCQSIACDLEWDRKAFCNGDGSKSILDIVFTGNDELKSADTFVRSNDIRPCARALRSGNGCTVFCFFGADTECHDLF